MEQSVKKAVRLQGFHGKYLSAEDDFVSVSQDRDGSSDTTLWRVEHVDNGQVLRLKSCYDCYLTATDIPCLLGGTDGKKVLQTRPSKLDPSIEWELIVIDDNTIKLRGYSGNYLHANTSLPPWRGSVTHDSFCPDWCLFRVEVTDFFPPKLQVSLLPKMPPLYDGRVVFYMVAEAESEVKESSDWHYVFFRGRNPEKLTRKLRKEIDLMDEKIDVCIRHPVNTNKLYPVHLQLPPGTSPIYLVVLKSSSSD